MLLMRTIREEKHVTSELAKCKQTHPVVEDVWEGVKWTLARKPEEGECFPDRIADKYLFKSTPTPQHPTILVLYDFDSDYVNIFDIKIDLPPDK